MRRALERDQFSLHYQPKVDMASGEITGVEALLRWNHPELGAVAGAIHSGGRGDRADRADRPLGAAGSLRAEHGLAAPRLAAGDMAVNLSPRQFADANLLHDVDEALLASGMSPALLELEVTESMVMRNVSRAIKMLDAIQSRGIRLAIDDFGTGYSSMALMKQFPIDTIKIDRSFVRDMPNDSDDRRSPRRSSAMGKALDMTVIAEGVETVEQEAFLRNTPATRCRAFCSPSRCRRGKWRNCFGRTVVAFAAIAARSSVSGVKGAVV